MTLKIGPIAGLVATGLLLAAVAYGSDGVTGTRVSGQQPTPDVQATLTGPSPGSRAGHTYAYNSGTADDGSALDVTEEEWDLGIAALVKSIFLGVKYAVPEMQKVGGGNIVTVSSDYGILMSPSRLVYPAGKSAAIGVTRQMATDFGPMGIRVNAVCPGMVLTERLEALWGDNPSLVRFWENQYPLRRIGRPVAIANAIVFLCSNEASFITGVALMVNGGIDVQQQEAFGIRQAQYLLEHPETRSTVLESPEFRKH